MLEVFGMLALVGPAENGTGLGLLVDIVSLNINGAQIMDAWS